MIHNIRATRLAMSVALAVVSLAARLCHADDYSSPTDERVRVSLGASFLRSHTSLRADSSLGVEGTQINGEDQFRLNRSKVEPKFQAIVRADTRQRISIDYFTLDRSGSSTVTNAIVFRDVVYLPGDPLQTQLNLRMLGLAYEYSFWHSETLEIAATLGVHATDISATASVLTATRHIIQTEDQAGAIPTVGIDATWVASSRFYFDGRIQYLDAHVQSISGSLGIYELDAVYRFRPNVSLSLGYTGIESKLTTSKTGHTGLFDFNTRGPQLFIRIGF